MSAVACAAGSWNAGTTKAGCANSRLVETEETAATTAGLGKQTSCMPRMAGFCPNIKPRGMRAPDEFRASLHGRRRSNRRGV